MKLSVLALAVLAGVYAKSSTKQDVLDARYGTDWPFSGLTTFAHLETDRCLVNPSTEFDIAVVGVPFDTAVSYRPGARFGPRAIRAASMRQSSLRGFNARAGVNPYQDWAKVIDCQDIPVTPVDNKLALHQMTEGFKELLSHNVASPKYGKTPRIVTLGGDHSIVLPHLRALKDLYGPITVIHFDAHLDTWLPTKYPSGWVEADANSGHFTHGSMFWMAHTEGLLAEDSCVHAGLRTRLSGTDYEDYADDSKQGFARISCDDIDTLGVDGIAQKIINRVGTNPVYISLDIDVIDPGMAPGTGTPEVGGWTTREMIALLRSLSDLNIVGADIVEVSPAFDNAEITALAGAQCAYELITNMVLSRREGVAHSDPSHDEL